MYHQARQKLWDTLPWLFPPAVRWDEVCTNWAMQEKCMERNRSDLGIWITSVSVFPHFFASSNLALPNTLMLAAHKIMRVKHRDENCIWWCHQRVHGGFGALVVMQENCLLSHTHMLVWAPSGMFLTLFDKMLIMVECLCSGNTSTC